MITKICSKCKQKKELSQFNKNKTRKDGHHTYCRKCSKDHYRRYYRRNSCEERQRLSTSRKKRIINIRERSHQYKVEKGCHFCDENARVCLDFHHIDPSTKSAHISELVSRGSPWERVLEEIDKCIVVCSNCHRKVHAGILEI